MMTDFYNIGTEYIEKNATQVIICPPQLLLHYLGKNVQFSPFQILFSCVVCE